MIKAKQFKRQHRVLVEEQILKEDLDFQPREPRQLFSNVEYIWECFPNYEHINYSLFKRDVDELKILLRSIQRQFNIYERNSKSFKEDNLCFYVYELSECALNIFNRRNLLLRNLNSFDDTLLLRTKKYQRLSKYNEILRSIVSQMLYAFEVIKVASKYEKVQLNLYWTKAQQNLNEIMEHNKIPIEPAAIPPARRRYRLERHEFITEPEPFAPIYQEPSRSRQMQRERISGPMTVRLQEILRRKVKKLVKKTTKGVQIQEDLQKVTFSKKGKDLIFEKDDINYHQIVKEFNIQDETSQISSSVLKNVRDYFVNNTNVGQMLTKSEWASIALAVIQIIVNVVQSLTGGKLFLSILGCVAAVGQIIISIIRLAGFGVIDVDIDKLNEHLASYIKAKVESIVSPDDCLPDTDAEIIERIFHTQASNENFQEKFTQERTDVKKKKNMINEIIPLQEHIVHENAVSPWHSLFAKISEINFQNIIKDKTFKIPIIKSLRTSQDNYLCLHHAIWGKRQKDGEVRMSERQVFTLDQIKVYPTDKAQILLMADNIDAPTKDEEVYDKLLEYVNADGFKLMEVCDLYATILNKDIIILNTDLTVKQTYRVPKPTDTIFLKFEINHFERVIFDTFKQKYTDNDSFLQTLKLINNWFYRIDMELVSELNIEVQKHFRNLHFALINDYNNMAIGGFSVQSFSYRTMSPANIAKYATTSGISMLSVIIALTTMFCDPKMQVEGTTNKMLKFFSLTRSSKAEMRENVDLISEFMADMFGIYITPQTINYSLIADMCEKMQDYVDEENTTYLENIKKFYEVKSYVEYCKKQLIMFKTSTKDQTHGYVNAKEQLTGLISKMETKLNSILSVYKTSAVRQETLPVRIYGAAGAGKTEFVSKHLVRLVAENLQIEPSVSTINFGDNKFYPVLNGENFMIYDEFLARRHEDPILGDFNGIHSSVVFLMDSAEVMFKAQPTPFVCSFLLSNSAYTDLSKKLECEAEKGFWSRLEDIHFCNVKQEQSHTRDQIPRGNFDDFTHYEYRQYTTTTGKHRNNPVICKPTPNLRQHYNEEEDKFDDTIYGAGDNMYKVLTLKQIVENISAKIKKFEKKFKNARSFNLKSKIVALKAKKTNITDQQITEHFKDQGYSRIEVMQHLHQGKFQTQEMINFLNSPRFKQEIDTIAIQDQMQDVTQNETLDHFVVNIKGPGGTGKTTIARKAATNLKLMLGMPLVEFNYLDRESAKSITKPSIIILNDCVYDELMYINFYDSLPKACIIFVTHNLVLNRDVVNVQNNLTNNNPVFEYLNTQDDSYFPKRWFNNAIRWYGTQPRAPVWTVDSQAKMQINGFPRRLGLFGMHMHGGMISKRSISSCQMYNTISGFRVFKIKEKGDRKGTLDYEGVTESEIISDIYSKFNSYCKHWKIADIKKLNSQLIDELITQNSQDIDILICAPSAEDLIKFTNNPSALVKTWAIPISTVSSGFTVKTTSRVNNCTFNFDPTEFAIPKNSKPDQYMAVARNMYRIVMQGNVDFTVIVKAGDFKAICKNGVINYCSDYEPEETAFTHTIVDKHITIQFTHENTERNLITNIHLKDFAQIVHNGIPPEEYITDITFDHYLMFLNYINNISTTESEIVNYMRLLDVKQSVKLAEIQEKLGFVRYFKYFESTSIYKFIMVLFGLATGVMFAFLINMLIKMVWGSKKKTTQLEYKGHKIDLVFDWKLNKRIDDRADNLVCDVACDVLNYKDDLINFRELKNLIIQRIKFNLIDNGFIKSDTCVELSNINIQSCKETKVLKTKPVETSNLTKVEGKEKSSMYDKQQKNIKLKTKEADALQAVLDKPSILSKIENNLVKVKTTMGDGLSKSLYGLDIGNGVIITMYHNLCLVNTNSNKYEEADHVQTTVKYLVTDEEFEVKPVMKDPYHDIVIFQIQNRNGYNARANLIKYFIRDKNRTKHTMSEMYTYDRVKNNNNGLNRTKLVGTTANIQLVKDTVNLTKGAFVYVTSVLFCYGMATKEGDCGLPLYALNDSHEILCGLHYGGNASHIGAVQITQEYLETVYSQIMEIEDEEFFDAVEIELDQNELEDETYFEFTEVTFDAFGKEETVVLDNHSLSILQDCDLGSKQTFECLEVGENTEPFGYTHKGARAFRLKSKYIPTPYTDEIDERIPREEMNSATSNKKVEDPSNLPVNRRGEPSILIGQQDKLNDPVDALGKSLGDKYLARALEILIPHYKKLYGRFKHRTLTDLEVINGTYINPRCPSFQNLEPIDRTGSIGYDVTSVFHIQHKNDVLKLFKTLPCGRHIYHYADTEAARYVRRQEEVTLHYWEQDKRCESLVQSNLKCELRPLEKVRVGKTRCFESFTMANSNATRRILGTLFAAIKMYRSEGFAQVGIDTVNFQQLYERFQRLGQFGEAGDFSAWDKHLMPNAIELVTDLWTETFFASWEEVDPTYRIKIRNQIHQILVSNYKAIIIADGNVFTKQRGNCSGAQTTTHLNGSVNDLYRVACILYLIDQHNAHCEISPKSEIKEKYEQIPFIERYTRQMQLDKVEINSMEDILKITDWVDYGDDLASVINLNYVNILNFVSFKMAYNYLFGITYDSPAKDGSIALLTPLIKLSFISRTFHLDENLNIITPRLKLSSINRLLHWTTSIDPDQLKTNLDEIFDELKFYDSSLYSSYIRIVKEIINPYLLKNYRTAYSPPNYHLLRGHYENAVKNVRKEQDAYIDASLRINEKNKILENFQRIIDLFATQGTQLTRRIPDLETNLLSENMTPETIKEYFESLFIRMRVNTQLKISGLPAKVTAENGAVFWSISCEPLYDTSLKEYRKDLQRILQSSRHFTFVTVEDLEIYIPNPLKRIQFRVIQRGESVGKEFSVHELRDALFNIQAATSAAMVDPMPKVTPGAPVPLQDSGLPVGLHQLGFSQKSTAMLAYEYAPLANYTIPVGSTSGKVILNLTRTDLVNEFMRACKTGDSYYNGSFKVKFVSQTNPGLTGTLLIGMTRSKLDSPTETDMLIKQTYQIDGNSSQNFELTISPFTDDVVKARFAWPPSEADDDYYPALVIIVKCDFVSTFDNPSLYSQIQLYTAFSPDFVTFFNGFPKNTGYNTRDAQLSINTVIPLDDVLGKDVRLFTDGNLFTPNIIQVTQSQVEVVASDTLHTAEAFEIKDQKRITRTWATASGWGSFISYENSLLQLRNPKSSTVINSIELLIDYAEGPSFTLNSDVDINEKRIELASIGKVDDRTNYMDIEFTNVWCKCYVSQKERDEKLDRKNMQTFLKYIEPNFVSDVTTYQVLAPLIKVKIDNKNKLQSFSVTFDFTELHDKVGTLFTMLSLNADDTSFNCLLTSVYGFNFTLVIPFDFSKLTQANLANFPDAITLPAGASSLQAVKLPFVVPPASTGAVNAAGSTLLPNISIFDNLSKVLATDKIYQLQLTTKDYSDLVGTFIFHGPKRTCFFNTNKIEYLVSSYMSQELNLRVNNVISLNAQLPVTKYNSSAFVQRNTKSLVRREISAETFNVQGAAASVGAGALMGVGQGLGNYLNMQQNFQNNKELLLLNQGFNKEQAKMMLEMQGANQLAAISAYGENQLGALGIKGANTLNAIAAQGENTKEQMFLQHTLNNLNTPGMSVQRSQNQNFVSGGHQYPDTQNSTTLETPIEQFDLHTGARIKQTSPIQPTVNSAGDDAPNTSVDSLSRAAIENTLFEESYHSPTPNKNPLAGAAGEVRDGMENLVDTIGDYRTLENLNMHDTSSTPTQQTRAMPKNKLANSHGLGADPGTKLSQMKFPGVTTSVSVI